MDIKNITTKEALLLEAIRNAALTNSKKRRRQTLRLKELICDKKELTSDDSDVVKATNEILSNMESITMIRYGATAYVEWYGRPPKDLIDIGTSTDHLYFFTSANLRDPISMYNDIDEKAEAACEILLTFIFNAAAGIDLRNRLESIKTMKLEHINLTTEHAQEEEIEALEKFADFVDSQNAPGAMAAGMLYPLLNDAYGKKRKHTVFGFKSNTGKGLLLAMISKLYKGAADDMPVRPNERDVYSAGAWNKMIIPRWIVKIGDTSEADITYDFMKNLYEHPISISGKNERSKEMFYGNVYIATNSQQDFFSDKEIYTRVFFLAMFRDIDQILGEELVSVLDNIHRDSIVAYLIKHEEDARNYWKNYQTPPSFYEDKSTELLYDDFLKRYDGKIAPVRDIKRWINNPRKYKSLMSLIKEYNGEPRNVSIDGKSVKAIDLRKLKVL